jgi:small ligand-binding sensory domain FIST
MNLKIKKFAAATCEINGPYEVARFLKSALEIREELVHPAQTAFVFATPDYRPFFAEMCDTLRVDGHILDVVGCTVGGWIAGEQEMETGSGCTVIALRAEIGDPVPLISDQFLPQDSRWLGEPPNAWVTLGNPFSFTMDSWLSESNKQHPLVPVVGGLASGGNEEETVVFINGMEVQACAVPLFGRTRIVPMMTHGCRPIGEPLPVTNAEQNVIYGLGCKPAYQVLDTVFQTLSEEDKSNARGNLLAGLAGSEYIDEFHSGDFMIRHIIGADPDSGAVVIAGAPRVGQTLQYQLRNREAAIEDLKRAFKPKRADLRKTFAALLFSCLGRGEAFFGVKNHDAACLSAVLEGKPVGGFFCNGEIAPVWGVNALHGYSAVAAMLIDAKLPSSKKTTA